MRDQDIGVVIGELTRIVKRASTNHAAIIERDPLIAARHPYFQVIGQLRFRESADGIVGGIV